ncbi:MAG: trypsin-like peptidase domain-containing protein [Gemmatimonadota bacterium]
MAARFSRFRFATAGAACFAVGVLFASAADLTQFSWAQEPTRGVPTAVRGPGAAEGLGSFADIAERVTPAVVAVRTTRTSRATNNRLRGRTPQGMEDLLEQFGQQPPRTQSGEGSGFITSTDGYIVTNNHVVADADQVSIVLSDGRTFRAKVVGTDSTTDVAVVKIEARNLPTLPIGNDETTRIGDWVLAIGNPLGLDFTVTAGIISAKGRGSELQLPSSGFSISDFIQTDAAINPGNSGGPLVNLRGEVIGLNSAIASATGFYSGYGFAIPITLVKSVTDALIKDGRVRFPVMGVQVSAVTPEDAGINGLTRVAGVKVAAFNPADAGPAKSAGIEVGDVIISVDGKPVERVSSLQRLVRTRKVGETVPVEVMRYGSKKTFNVKLMDAEGTARVASADREPAAIAAPAATTNSKLGVTVEAPPAEMLSVLGLPADRGVRVTEVSQSGPAREGRLLQNDIILEVLFPTPRRVVRSTTDLQNVLNTLKDGDYISLLVRTGQRGAPNRVVNLRVGS